MSAPRIPRIVDAVWRTNPGARRHYLAFGVLAALALHAGVAAWGIASAPSLELWSAELATRVHAELTREQVVDVPPPPVEKPAPLPPPPAAPPEKAPARARRAPSSRPAPPPSPAQAGRIVAADPSAVVDLPATTFVTGNAPTYAGGVTASTGRSTGAVNGPVSAAGPAADRDRGGAGGAGGDRSAPVALGETDWSCSWPAEADSQQIDEQWVTLQVIVRADGTAESVKALSDPGHGFAGRARACALATRFKPARDRQGHPVRASSPPIRVHFTR